MRRRDRIWHQAVAERPWRPAERRVVLRGFWGRLTIAIEPFVIAIFFVVLPLLLLLRKTDTAIFVAPIFAGAGLLFLAYAIVLMVSPTRALLETFGSIHVVDGYVQYRMHVRPLDEPAYFVAVLDHDRNVLGEWALAGRPKALDRSDLWPALVEFSRYGGIHRIDGRSTGVLPDDIPAFGVGVPQAYAELLGQRELDRIRRGPDAAEAGGDDDEGSLHDDDEHRNDEEPPHLRRDPG